MQKSEATKLAKVINYFSKGHHGEIWEATTEPVKEGDWKVKVRLTNSAFTHELNALMMVVNNTMPKSCYQWIDDDEEILWKIW